MENFDSILIQFSLWLVRSCDGQMRGLDWNTICPNKNQIISQWPIWVWGTFVIRSIRLPHYNTQNNSSSLSTHPSQVQMIYGGDCQNLSHDLDPTNIKIASDWFVLSALTVLEKNIKARIKLLRWQKTENYHPRRTLNVIVENWSLLLSLPQLSSFKLVKTWYLWATWCIYPTPMLVGEWFIRNPTF